MEYLVNLHGSEYLFYGGRPTTLAECCRKHSLSLGMSAQMSAKDSRKGLIKSARGFSNAVRQHRPHVIPSDLLNRRYEAVRMRAGREEGPQADLPALELLMEFQKRKPDIALVKKDDNSAYLVPLLSLMQKAIAADEKHLTFDYFAMHQRCWALLEQIQNHLRDDLTVFEGSTGENYLGSDQMTLRQIPGIIYNIISVLGEKRGAFQSFPMAQMVVKTQKVVKLAATEMGSVGLDAVSQTLAASVVELEPGATTSDVDTDDHEEDNDDSGVDEHDLAVLTAMLDFAPKRLVTNEEAKLAYKRATRTPLNKMPPDVQEYLKIAQGNGSDLSQGIMGFLKDEWQATAELTPQQQERVLATTTLKEYNNLLKTFKREAAEKLSRIGSISDVTDGKKKRNNKNKNKNRKLKQKEARATGAEDLDAGAGALCQ